jgi:hypothetical protein
VAVEVVVVEVVEAVVNNSYHHNRMNSSTHFFLLYILICCSIILLFYFIFKRSEVPRTGTLTKIPTPYEFLRRKMNKGIPGMDKTEVGKSLSMPDPLRRKMNKGVPGNSERGKPLPAPKMPVAPVPLIVRV